MSDLDRIRKTLKLDEEDWMTDGQAIDAAIHALEAAGCFVRVETPKLIQTPDSSREAIVARVWYNSQDSLRYLILRSPWRG